MPDKMIEFEISTEPDPEAPKDDLNGFALILFIVFLPLAIIFYKLFKIAEGEY